VRRRLCLLSELEVKAVVVAVLWVGREVGEELVPPLTWFPILFLLSLVPRGMLIPLVPREGPLPEGMAGGVVVAPLLGLSLGGVDVVDVTRAQEERVLYSTPQLTALQPSSVPAVGGRLAGFLSQWSQITGDQWVLEIVASGLTLAFTSDPPTVVSWRQTPVPVDPDLRSVLEEELCQLLLKRAVVTCPVGYRPRFMSTFFLAPKKGGLWRPILNLKPLNVHIVPIKFKMETLSLILQSLSGLWVTSIDLKDAYLHVPVRVDDQSYLCFMYKGILYRFQAMPFGLSTAPRIFTRMTKVVAAHLRRRGIQIFMYLDDWLIVSSSREQALLDLEVTLRVTQDLGWVVNFKKSNLIPTQSPIFLGAQLDLVGGRVFPSLERLCVLEEIIRRMSGLSSQTARIWLRVLGLMASMVDLVPYCRLRMRPLQWALLSHFRPVSKDYELLVPISPDLLPHLSWWLDRSNTLAGCVFPVLVPDLDISTDASLLGWGAVVGFSEDRASGLWADDWLGCHINLLELEAVLRALQAFQVTVCGRSVLVRTDSTTVVAYINRQGGTHSLTLWKKTWLLFQWALEHQVTLSAIHVPGVSNVAADALSRGRDLLFEWCLKRGFFQQLCQLFQLEVDLFASPLNAQLPRFCARFPDGEAWKVDALSFRWEGWAFYAFPPLALLMRILLKVQQDRPRSFLLVCPLWPSRPWFRLLLRLVVDFPLILPNVSDLLVWPETG